MQKGGHAALDAMQQRRQEIDQKRAREPVANSSSGARLVQQQREQRVRAAAAGALTTAGNDTGGKMGLECGRDARLHERQQFFDEQWRSDAYIRKPLPKGDGISTLDEVVAATWGLKTYDFGPSQDTFGLFSASLEGMAQKIGDGVGSHLAPSLH
jgi:hypothetical protein